jgi:hypothetical protein
MATIQNARSLDYLDMQAYVGITKHNGGFGATDELLSLCHIKEAQEALWVEEPSPEIVTRARLSRYGYSNRYNLAGAVGGIWIAG